MPKTLQGQYAGFVSRFLAYIIDVIVVIITVAVVGITLDIILRFFNLQALLDRLMQADNVLGDILRTLAVLGSVAAIAVGYFVLGWTVTGGQSVGKVLIGLRIVPLNGSKMSLWRSSVRYVAFILSALVLFLGLLWVLISDSRQGWHDKIARTCVIYDWPAHEDDGVIGRLTSRWQYIRHTRRRFKDKRKTQKEAQLAREANSIPEEG
jgi:uncharacterized RDD family membrane protein YckC